MVSAPKGMQRGDLMRQFCSYAALACVLSWSCLGSGADARTVRFRVVWSLTENPGDGRYIYAGLINAKGILYGTTSYGGNEGCYEVMGCGTFFSVNPATGVATWLHRFGANYANEGATPAAGLIKVGSTLYGTTMTGGANGCHTRQGSAGCGAVYSWDLKTGTYAAPYALPADGSAGIWPVAALVDVGPVLYGTTSAGGNPGCHLDEGCGTVFSLNTATGAVALVYSFKGGNDGGTPTSGLINVGGILYGTTWGGTNATGTAFSLDPATGNETVLHSFLGGSDGANPAAGLLDVDGTLYGTTSGGGAAGDGTVFTVNPTTGAESVVYSFKGGNDGAQPLAGLIRLGGKLYGTTSQGGGSSGLGTVFSLDLKTGAEKVVHSFQPVYSFDRVGIGPEAGLISVGGTLYGTTSSGGDHGAGTVFAVTP